MRPEFHITVHTKKKHPLCLCKCAMSAFDRSILAGVVQACGTDGVSLFGKEILHFWMVEELATLIQMQTLVCAGRIASTEKVQQPLKWRTLGDASASMFHSSEVISHKHPTSFAIQSQTSNKFRHSFLHSPSFGWSHQTTCQ